MSKAQSKTQSKKQRKEQNRVRSSIQKNFQKGFRESSQQESSKNDSEIPIKNYSILQNIGYYFKYYCQNMPAFLWLGLGEILAGSIIPYIEIYLPKLVVELVTEEYSMQGAVRCLLMFGILCILVFVVKGGCEQGKYFLYNGQRNNMIAKLFLKQLKLPYFYTEGGKGKELYWKAVGSLDGGDWSSMYRFSYDTINILKTGICFVLYSTILSYLSLRMMLLLLLLSLIQYGLCIARIRYMERFRDQDTELYKKKNYILYSTIGNESAAKDIRIFGMKKWLLYHKTELIRQLRDLDKKKMRKEKLYWQAGSFLALGRDLFAYIYLIRQAGEGMLDAGEFVLYFGAITGFATFVNSIMNSVASLREGCNSVNYYRTYMELEEDETENAVRTGDEIRTPVSIEFRNVSFHYSSAEEEKKEQEEWIFRHLNLKIAAGEKLAVVGVNGAGKTTLVKLMCGLFEPDEGEILINDIPMKEFSKADIYRIYAAVFQEPFLLPFTVGENLSLSVEYDTERCWQALKEAGLKEVFIQKKVTMDTYFGKDMDEDGLELSGGQKQRFLLARALYKNAPVLILDEPTAALDPIAEGEIYDEYARLSREKTAVFISHRLASTRFSDRIVLIGNGGILEEGTHKELLEKGGVYAEMFEVQRSYYEKEKLGREAFA